MRNLKDHPSKDSAKEENVVLSISSIKNGLRRLRITLKSASVQVDRRNSPNTIEQRKIYALHLSENGPEYRENNIY